MAKLGGLLLLLRVFAILVAEWSTTSGNQLVDTDISVDATRNHFLFVQLNQTFNIMRLATVQ